MTIANGQVIKNINIFKEYDDLKSLSQKCLKKQEEVCLALDSRQNRIYLEVVIFFFSMFSLKNKSYLIRPWNHFGTLNGFKISSFHCSVFLQEGMFTLVL